MLYLINLQVPHEDTRIQPCLPACSMSIKNTKESPLLDNWMLQFLGDIKKRRPIALTNEHINVITSSVCKARLKLKLNWRSVHEFCKFGLHLVCQVHKCYLTYWVGGVLQTVLTPPPSPHDATPVWNILMRDASGDEYDTSLKFIASLSDKLVLLRGI